jgi:hypothetical protein
MIAVPGRKFHEKLLMKCFQPADFQYQMQGRQQMWRRHGLSWGDMSPSLKYSITSGIYQWGVYEKVICPDTEEPLHNKELCV